MDGLQAALTNIGFGPLPISIIVILVGILTFSTKVAELGGKLAWLGALARWYQRRNVRRVEQDEELNRVRVRTESRAYLDLERELGRLSRQLRAQQTRHDRELRAQDNRHLEDMKAIRGELNAATELNVALLRWAHSARNDAARVGLMLSGPPDPITE